MSNILLDLINEVQGKGFKNELQENTSAPEVLPLTASEISLANTGNYTPDEFRRIGRGEELGETAKQRDDKAGGNLPTEYLKAWKKEEELKHAYIAKHGIPKEENGKNFDAVSQDFVPPKKEDNSNLPA